MRTRALSNFSAVQHSSSSSPSPPPPLIRAPPHAQPRAGFLPHLHALAHADTQGVDLKALITSLNSANNIYSHMIQ